jgi:hypothetical protein
MEQWGMHERSRGWMRSGRKGTELQRRYEAAEKVWSSR